MVRRLATAVIGVCFFGLIGMSSASAIMCGPNDCTEAGPIIGSPFSPPDLVSFSTALSDVTPTPAPGTGFFHAWSFGLSQFSSISGTLTNNNSLGGFDILGLTLELFTAANVQIPGTFFVPNGGANPFVAFAYGGLAAGDYFFKIAGQLPLSAKDGRYTGEFSVSEVPLPGAVWLFISAILGLVSFSRIRRGKQSV